MPLFILELSGMGGSPLYVGTAISDHCHAGIHSSRRPGYADKPPRLPCIVLGEGSWRGVPSASPLYIPFYIYGFLYTKSADFTTVVQRMGRSLLTPVGESIAITGIQANE